MLIKNIKIVGINKIFKKDLYLQLDYIKNTNILFVKREQIDKIMDNYTFFEYYSVKKRYPSELFIEIQNTTFLASTIKKNKKYFIGSNGKFTLSDNHYVNHTIPNVFGNFHPNDFLNLINTLKQTEFNIKKITDFYYFNNERWDIKTIDNITIKFPTKISSDLLRIAEELYELNKNKKNIIDLRVANQVIISNG